MFVRFLSLLRDRGTGQRVGGNDGRTKGRRDDERGTGWQHGRQDGAVGRLDGGTAGANSDRTRWTRTEEPVEFGADASVSNFLVAAAFLQRDGVRPVCSPRRAGGTLTNGHGFMCTMKDGPSNNAASGSALNCDFFACL